MYLGDPAFVDVPIRGLTDQGSVQSRAALIDPAKAAFHARNGLVWQQGDRLGVTDAGMLLLDALLAELVAPGLVAA